MPLQKSEEKYVRGWRGPKKQKTRNTLCLATPQHWRIWSQNVLFCQMYNQWTSPQRLYGVRTGEQKTTREVTYRCRPSNRRLAKDHNSPWLTWRSRNQLRTGYACNKEQKKWKYYDGDTMCVCGLATENTTYLLHCSLLTRPCTLDDLLEFNDTERWKKTVWWHDMMMM